MRHEFCIIGAEYVMEGSGRDERPVMMLWGRTRQGKSILVLDRTFRPYFYAHFEGNAAELRSKIMKLEVEGEHPSWADAVEKKILGKPAKLMEVVARRPASVPKFRDLIKEWVGIRGEYEYSMPFHKRYLIGRRLRPMSWSSAEGSADKKGPFSVDIVFDAETVKPVGEDAAPPGIFRVLAVSISLEKEKLSSISLAGTGGFSRKISGGEKEILEKFVSAVSSFNPDFIVGYGTDAHDFNILNAKAAVNKVALGIGRDGSQLSFQKRGRGSCAEVSGRSHIDLSTFVENILSPGMDADTMELGEVAGELVGPGKGSGAALVLKLAENLLPQIFEIASLVGQDPFDVSRMAYSQLVEALLMREACGSGEIILNRPKSDEISKRMRVPPYTGGYVHQPRQGVHDNVALFDFASLYPSITITHNISPETIDCDCCRESEKARVPGVDHYFCTKRHGFIPKVLQDLVLRRSELKAKMRKLKEGSPAYRQLYNRQYAMKIIANASYGYYGYAGSRWYSRIAAECITAWGRHYIRKVIDIAAGMGYDVIYGDTDSLFMKVKDRKDAMKFLQAANASLPGVMEMDLQGIYKSCIFVPTKEGVTAKKRYALLSKDGRLVIRGFEKVRRDWSPIAKETQETVLRHVLRDKSPEKAAVAVRKAVARLESGDADMDELVIRTRLTRPLEEYSQIGPHVAAARKLSAAGRTLGEGDTVTYVVTKGEGSISERSEPAETARSYDPGYYINNQVIPASLRVLSVFGYTEENIMKPKEGGQPSLASFAGRKKNK